MCKNNESTIYLYRVYIDAQYVPSGLAARSKHYSAGSNGDIWSRIYAILDRRVDGDIRFIKIKPHIDTVEEYIKHKPSTEGLILNELADAAATVATDRYGACALRVNAEKVKLKEAYLISKRIGTIEASIWKSQPERKHFDPNHSKIR